MSLSLPLSLSLRVWISLGLCPSLSLSLPTYVLKSQGPCVVRSVMSVLMLGWRGRLLVGCLQVLGLRGAWESELAAFLAL